MRIAAEHGIDLEQVEGTGRGGRVRKQDVLALPRGRRRGGAEEPPMHIESPYRPDEPAPAKPRSRASRRRRAGAEAPRGTAPLSRMRQSIGARMLAVAADRGDLHDDRRGRHDPDRGARREKTGFTYLPYVARATIETLREFPALNATLEGEQSRPTTASTWASPSRSARAA